VDSHREDCAKENESQWKKKSARLHGQALSTQGDLSLTQLKNQVKANAPIFLRLGHQLPLGECSFAVDRLSAHKINGRHVDNTGLL